MCSTVSASCENWDYSTLVQGLGLDGSGRLLQRIHLLKLAGAEAEPPKELSFTRCDKSMALAGNTKPAS